LPGVSEARTGVLGVCGALILLAGRLFDSRIVVALPEVLRRDGATAPLAAA
jgi:hypothetical protein